VVWSSELAADAEVRAQARQRWGDDDVVVGSESIRASRDSHPQVAAALRSSVPLAIFGRGRSRVEVRHVVTRPATRGDATAGRGPGSGSAEDPAERATLGDDLARNPAIDLASTARRRLEQGEVDERVMTALAALAADQTLQVTQFPHEPAETAAGSPRRMVELRLATAADAQAAGRMLQRQESPYRPAATDADGTRLTVTYPVAALT
jgi:hypothetical protein